MANGGADSDKSTVSSDAPILPGGIEVELIQQARNEHALRMHILQMKQRFWQLKIDALLRENQN